jgi:hypothetical protein
VAIGSPWSPTTPGAKYWGALIPSNCITLNDQGSSVLTYTLSEADKKRFRTGVALGIRRMFLAGAKSVILPSNEN